MRSLQVLVIEDNYTDSLLMEADLTAMGHSVCGIADNMKDALGIYLEKDPDIILIDIMLHGKKEGIAIAEKISSSSQKKQPFIFITSLMDRPTFDQAKATFPISYLTKPFNKLELEYAIELALQNKQQHNTSASDSYAAETFFIKKGNHLIKVPIMSVFYIEVEGKFSNIFCERGKFLIELPLKEVMERLQGFMFVRISRNCIVNLKEVKEIDLTEDVIILQNNTRIYMTRRYKADFLEQFKPLK
ncbi:LytTR family DNA-binding domain-containing protein [Chitinophaga sp. CF118]|uniref:LytR/AlgR family response regulator transcription factor n=1 Tax=Chitinophaga sp. CF118 TaxID=1884367 RepID=UPI0015A50A79|nr:response regulator transcription factor [Chitinophaga sp. CF118]